MKKLHLAALAAAALALVPTASAGSPPGQWGGTADVTKQSQVTKVVAETDEYAFMNVPALRGKTFSQIDELGFDSLEDSRIGAGAPRFSILFDDKSYLFPSALYCQKTLADGTVHTDFLSESNCVVYGFTETTGFVAKTWAQWGDVFEDAEITWAGLVIDEPGDYALTNIVARP